VTAPLPLAQTFGLNATDLTALALSAFVALSASILVGLIGTPLAWYVAKRPSRFSGAIVALSSLPLVMPPTVTGYFMLEFVGRNALLGLMLERYLGVVLVFHWSGAVLAAAVSSFPLFFLAARAAFAGVDPDFEQAARLMGCGEIDVFRRVTLPLAMHGLAIALLLGFVRALGDFGATLMVAGNVPGRTQTAALALYDAATLGEAARARTLAAMLSVFALAALWFAGQTPASRRT
jgi:molybdate transport system permease protein